MKIGHFLIGAAVVAFSAGLALPSSAAVSDRGLSEKRPQNEDSYLEMPAIGIFAVADGVGGAQAGLTRSVGIARRLPRQGVGERVAQ